MSSKRVNGYEKELSFEEQQQKISEIRKLLGPVSGKLSLYCTDASISRYLRARNWNVKKALKMLKETLKWRYNYKPEEILWEEVAQEAETGKIYRSTFTDRTGRTVLVMRPSCKNTNSTKGQIKYLVYCMENALINLPPDQEQMVWLIDFDGFNLSHLSVKITRETAHVLQEHYPERLGMAILYNPPKIFESFWTVVKPLLEPKTYRKVKFVYSDDLVSKKIMEDHFDMNTLERAFGGHSELGFNIAEYAERMKKDDGKRLLFWNGVDTHLPVSSSKEALSNLVTDNDPSDSDESNEISENSSHGAARAIQSENNVLGSTVGNVDYSCNGTEKQPSSNAGDVAGVSPILHLESLSIQNISSAPQVSTH